MLGLKESCEIWKGNTDGQKVKDGVGGGLW